MGTTLTFLAFCTDGVLVAHIGDSRVYQFRRGQGVVFRTRDHSLVEDLIAAGELTPDEARTHPRRNIITRAVQPHQESPVRATFRVLTDVRRGDLFLLCSDGVTEQLEDAAYFQIANEKFNERYQCPDKITIPENALGEMGSLTLADGKIKVSPIAICVDTTDMRDYPNGYIAVTKIRFKDGTEY